MGAGVLASLLPWDAGGTIDGAADMSGLLSGGVDVESDDDSADRADTGRRRRSTSSWCASCSSCVCESA